MGTAEWINPELRSQWSESRGIDMPSQGDSGHVQTKESGRDIVMLISGTRRCDEMRRAFHLCGMLSPNPRLQPNHENQTSPNRADLLPMT